MVTTQLNRGFGTFVVGLATSNDAQATMTLTLDVGERWPPARGTPNYYLANNTDELVAALATISRLRCGPAPSRCPGLRPIR